MFVDCRSLPDGFDLAAEICIVGAGAAGITIANELKGSGIKVCLLESGGTTFDLRTEALYDYENKGIPLKPPIETRLRMFGGTTNHWDGRCGPLDPYDFERREWVPLSGWPLSRSDLDPFYERAAGYCDLKLYPFSNAVAGGKGIALPDLDKSPLQLHLWQYSAPTRFGPKFQSALERAADIQVMLNANVMEFVSSENRSRIERVKVRTLSGIKGTVRARYFVLACGGIENARLLLCSDRAAGGTGNRSGMVGRCFMEHLRLRHTLVQLGSQYALAAVFNDDYEWPEGRYQLGMSTRQSFQVETRTLNSGYWFYYEDAQDSAIHRLVRLLKNQRLPDESVAKDLYEITVHADEVYLNARRRLFAPGSSTLATSVAVMVTETEQAPNPDSRITLATQRDELGQPRAAIDWRLTDIDRHNAIEVTRVAAKELAKLYNVRVRSPSWMDNDWEKWQQSFVDVSHHMGTTRMAENPRDGVVDSQCRVHGVENLYVAGASVFATSGHVNPTFTIVALALRLADHLKGVLAAHA